MKRILIIIIILVTNCHVMFSQETLSVFFVDAMTNGVPVYSNDTCANNFTTIKEHKEKEDWHNVEILEQSNNRYKVNITSCRENDSTSIKGWVNKELCGVWLRGKYIKRDFFTISFYTKPGLLKPFMKLSSRYFGDFERYTNGQAASVLDYKLHNGEYWIQTVIIKDNKKIVGWTKDFCPSVYDACN